MPDTEIGYHEDPKNSNGIIRARTTGQLRSWHIPRAMKALENLNNETGKVVFPGNYILFDQMKVYIGEAGNIYDRLKTHIKTPDAKIKIGTLLLYSMMVAPPLNLTSMTQWSDSPWNFTLSRSSRLISTVLFLKDANQLVLQHKII